MHLRDGGLARRVLGDDLLGRSVGRQRVAAAVERQLQLLVLGEVVKAGAVCEASAAQPHPEVALECGEVLDGHSQRGDVGMVRACMQRERESERER